MARRGPQGDPIQLVQLKNVPAQVDRAMKSGRMAQHELAENITKDLPVIHRDTPEVFTREVTAEEFRKMIVDSVAGLQILRSPDEILLNITVQLLVDIQRLHVKGVPPSITNDKGEKVKNPDFDAYLKLVRQATQQLSHLGMNPSTRAKILADTASAGKDALEAANVFNPFSRE